MRGFKGLPLKCWIILWLPFWLVCFSNLSLAETDPPEEPLPHEDEGIEQDIESMADPLEPVNRLFFLVNDKFYFWLLKPVATGYKTVVPQDARVGIRNFFSNVATPIRLSNGLLQLQFKGAGNEILRFLLNTLFGLGGALDLAKRDFHIEKEDRDFGQTLGSWGMGSVLYVHWPFLGPSSLRDTLGTVGDILVDPRTYLIHSLPVSSSLLGYEKVNETSLTIGEYEDLKKGSLDPYIAVREAYDQYRQNKIKGK